MKKLLLALVCSVSALLFADTDLRVQKFSKPDKGTAEVVSTGWKNYGLKITAPADADAKVTYDQMFHFYPGMFYEVSGDFSGTGEIFVEMYFFNQDNTPYKVPVKRALMFCKRGDFKAKFDLREFTAADAPRRFKVVIGVKKGGTALLEDMELEVDDD